MTAVRIASSATVCWVSLTEKNAPLIWAKCKDTAMCNGTKNDVFKLQNVDNIQEIRMNWGVLSEINDF